MSADQPYRLDSVDWDALVRAKLQVELLAPAVVAANARLGHAQGVIHAAREARGHLWTRYVERRRRWENPTSR